MKSVAHSSTAASPAPAGVVDAVSTRYDAFLSYAHDVDRPIAVAFQEALETVGRTLWQWIRRLPAIRVYRDETDLDANPELLYALRAALERAEHFVLLASPRSARSEWVDYEVATWVGKDPERRRLYVALVEGSIVARRDRTLDPELTTALSANVCALLGREPLYVDLTRARDPNTWTLRNAVFRDAALTITAPIRGIPKRRLARMQRRTDVKVALTVTGVVAAIVGFQEWGRLQRRCNLASSMAAKAAAQLHVAPATGVRSMEEALAIAAWPAQLGLCSFGDARQQLRELLRGAATQRRFDAHAKVSVVRLDGAERWLLTVSDRMVHVRDPRTGDPVATLVHDDTVKRAAIAPDGTRVLTTDGAAVRLWTLDQATTWHAEVVSDAEIVYDVAFDREGRPVTAGYPSVTTWKRDGTAWRPESSVRAEEGGMAADFRRVGSAVNGTRTVAASAGTLWTWTGDDSEPKPLWSSDGEIRAAQVSANGDVVFAAAKDEAVWWSHGLGGAPATLAFEGKLVAAAMSPAGDLVAMAVNDGDQGRILAWNASAGEPSIVFESPTGLQDIAVACGGRCVLTASADSSVRFWDFDGGNAFVQSFRAATAVGVDAAGTTIVTGDRNGTVLVRDRIDGRRLAAFPRDDEAVDVPLHVQIDEDHGAVVVAYAIGRVRRLSLASRHAIWDFDGQGVLRLFALDDASGFAFTASDQKVALWNTRAEPVTSFALDVHDVLAARFMPDGRGVVTATRDGIQTWSLAPADPVIHEIPGTVAAASFDCAASRVATASGADVVVSSVSEPRPDVGPLPHVGPVQRVTLSCDGSVVAATANDDRVRAWDVHSGAVLVDWQAPYPLVDLELSHDARLLAVMGRAGGVVVWGIAQGNVVAEPIAESLAAIAAAGSATSSRDLEKRLTFTANDRLLVARSAVGLRVMRREAFSPLSTLLREFHAKKEPS